MVTLATTAKAAQVARMAWSSTSVVETPAAMVAMVTTAKTAEWPWRPTPGPCREPKGALVIVARQPEGPAVTLGNGDKASGVIGNDAQRWSDEPVKQTALPTKTRRGLLVPRTDVVFEGWVKH